MLGLAALLEALPKGELAKSTDRAVMGASRQVSRHSSAGNFKQCFMASPSINKSLAVRDGVFWASYFSGDAV